MALGNGNPKEGDKGSNFFWELKVLQGLEAIAVAIEAGGGGGGGTYDSGQGISKNIAPANDTFELGYTTFALADAVGAKFSAERVISTDVSRLAIYGKPPGGSTTEAVYIENATTALSAGYGLRVRNANSVTSLSHAAVAVEGNGSNGFIATTNSLTRYATQFGTISTSAVDLVRTPVNIFSTRIGGGLVGHAVRAAFSLSNSASTSFFGGYIGYETISPTANSEFAKFFLSTKDSTTATPTTKLEIYGPNIFLLTQGLSEYADDAAAAVGGIPVNGLYKTGSFIKIRVS